jgi:hypothetical protein
VPLQLVTLCGSHEPVATVLDKETVLRRLVGLRSLTHRS